MKQVPVLQSMMGYGIQVTPQDGSVTKEKLVRAFQNIGYDEYLPIPAGESSIMYEEHGDFAYIADAIDNLLESDEYPSVAKLDIADANDESFAIVLVDSLVESDSMDESKQKSLDIFKALILDSLVEDLFHDFAPDWFVAVFNQADVEHVQSVNEILNPS